MTFRSARSRGLILVALALVTSVSYSFVLKPLFSTPDLFGKGVSGREVSVAITWSVYFTGLVMMALGLLWPRNAREVFRGLREVCRYRRRVRLVFAMCAYTVSLLGFYLLLATGIPIGEINFTLDLDSALAIVLAWIFLKGEWAKTSWRNLLGVVLAALGWYIVVEKGALPREAVLLVLTYVVGAACADVLVKPCVADIDRRVLLLFRWVFILAALGIYSLSLGQLQQCLPGTLELITWQAPGAWRLYLVAAVLIGIFGFRFWAYRYIEVWEFNSWMFLQTFLGFAVSMMVPGEEPQTDQPLVWGLGAVIAMTGVFLISFGRNPKGQS